MPSRNILLFVLFLASLLPACKEQPAMPAELQEINEMLEKESGNPFYLLEDYQQKAQEQPEAIRIIEEDYTGQEWTLKDSTKTLLGYPCQLATCSYHGRDYQAWFTSDIAIDNGPWKFKGLPGLILEVYDTKNHYHFLIEGIERTNIAPVCFYYTLPDPRTAERTDRIRYLQLKEEGTAGVPGFIQKTGLSGGKKKDRQKNAQRQCIAYDYMETDYHTH